MARIRSIHPGFATDEAFVTVSIPARYLFLLLLTECDDQGVFVSKETTLKMRLLPVDNIDVGALLNELLLIKAVTFYEVGGANYGAVRNFRKFQRPKSPNAIHPMTDDIRKWVGLGDPISEMPEPERRTFPGNGEISPQMEDGGGRREGEKEKTAYAFEGRVVRLNREDHDGWRKAYPSIPDLDAELQRIDDALFADGKLKGWFPAASAMLAAKHQKNLERAKAAARSPITPLGVGG